MTIDPSLAMSLKAVAAVMTDAADPWWIITSAAVALHGADPGVVADVDILLSVADAGHILPVIGVEAKPGSEHADFRSTIFGTWRGAPLPVEFMAGFSHRSEAGWLPVEPSTRQAIQIDGATVFVPDRAELQRILHRFGRPKDIERAKRLAALS